MNCVLKKQQELCSQNARGGKSPREEREQILCPAADTGRGVSASLGLRSVLEMRQERWQRPRHEGSRELVQGIWS